MTLRRFLLLILSLVAMCLPSLAVRVTLQVQNERGQTIKKVAVGEKYYIIAHADGAGSVSFQPGNTGSREIFQQKTGSNTNGHATFSIVYLMRAQTPGKYTVGPATSGGASSARVTFEISGTPSGGAPEGQRAPTPPANASQPSQGGNMTSGPQFIGGGNENMFLRASVSKTSVYEQEALVYTIKLYTTFNYIKFLGATAAPKFDGFVVEEDKVTDSQFSFENYNGKTYKAAVVARYIVFPQKSGKLLVEGNTYTVSADAFEYYHDPFWGQMEVKRPIQLNIKPNDLTVDVKPLPLPKPALFSGGVGKFTITANLPNQTYKTNQASRIDYRVTGQGNLKYIKLPDMSAVFPSQLEVFAPESTVDAQAGISNVTGNVAFTYSFMPTETGRFQLPPVKLIYFNPETGQYETSESRGFTIEVGKGEASSKSQTVNRFDGELMNVGSLEKTHPVWIHSWSYWLWYVVPAVMFVMALAGYRRYMALHADMDSYRRRKAGRMAARRLRKAAACMKRDEHDLFYDEMLAALWGFFSEKLGMPTSELTRRNVRDVLVEHAIPEADADEAIRLLDDCEFAKYSPALAAKDMESVYSRGSDIISRMNSKFRKNVVVKTENPEFDEIL